MPRLNPYALFPAVPPMPSVPSVQQKKLQVVADLKQMVEKGKISNQNNNQNNDQNKNINSEDNRIRKNKKI